MPQPRDRQSGVREPRVQPEPTPLEARLNGLFERIESVLTLTVGVVLIGFVLVALVAVGDEVREPLFVQRNFTEAVLRGIDAVFLAIILLELLHTTLARGPVSQQLQEFLVIGITAAIRHGLEVAASGRGGNPREVVINLGINSGGALLLVIALWLIRLQLHAERQAGAPQTAGARPPGPVEDRTAAEADDEAGEP